jgi:hypothetical protein
MDTPPAPTPTPQAREEIALQKAAVARLKKDIVGVDGNARRRYIREFHDEFSHFEAVSSFDDLVIACYKADIAYIGDYHVLPAAQEFAARLIGEIADRARQVVLCVEMVFARNQRTLDRYMKGEIDDDEFLRAIRYQQDWGYDWASFRRLFDLARRRGLPVFGIDSEPRSGFRYINRRDAHAAAHIAAIAERHPGARIVVVIGESHLARNHLPRKVRDQLKKRGLEKRGVIVLQNLEAIHWELAERGLGHADVVTLGPDRYCHFNTSPIAKYEAYRQAVETWDADGDEGDAVDLAPTLYNVIDAILKFLRIDKYSCPVRQAGGRTGFLVDVFPDVYSGLDEKELRRLLRGQKLTPEEAEDVMSHVQRHGSCFVPRMNAIFIGQFNMVHAGEEAAHFVNLALKNEIYDAAPREMPQHDLFYTGVLEEALGFFGSKLIDPTRNHFFETAFYQYYRKEREVIERDTPYSYEDFNAIIDFILLHKKFETGYQAYEEVPAEILDGIKSEPRRANILIHELGYFLGQEIYDAYHAGRVDRKTIVGLFRRSFRESGSALRTYLDLTERLRAATPSSGTAAPLQS